MNAPLVCRVYFDSRRQADPLAPAAAGAASPPSPPAMDEKEPASLDIATDPAAAEHLLRLGISAERDLPALALAEAGGKVRILGLRLTPEETARLAAGQGLPPARLVVYSSSWCPDCRNAKRVLHDADAPFEEVDIDQDPSAEALVLERSGGRRVVPTLRFDDRLWAFNPAPPLLRRLLSGA
jgi:mycoredoxin